MWRYSHADKGLGWQQTFQVLSTQNVNMEMWHFLVCICTMIGRNAKTTIHNAHGLCGCFNPLPEILNFCRARLRRKVDQRHVGTFWDYQYMHLSLRIDVSKRQIVITLCNFSARNFTTQNFGKNILVVVHDVIRFSL